MADANKRELLLIGSTNAGKTNYVAALARNLISRLSLFDIQVDMPTDRTTLIRLATPLLEGRYHQRTSAERHELSVAFRVSALAESGAPKLDLRLGDYSGEEVLKAFTDREVSWTDDWRRRAIDARALLICLRADDRIERHLYPSNALPPSPAPRDPLGAEALFPGVSDGPLAESTPPHPKTPVRLPNELEVLETLQFLRHERRIELGERPERGTLPVFVLLTAWDRVAPSAQAHGPARFFAQMFPTLRDFLASNFSHDELQILGLSSTSIDLTIPENSLRAREDEEIARGYVDFDGDRGPQRFDDIFLPIYLALYGPKAWKAIAPKGRALS